MRITNVLVAEHSIFLKVFAEIERALPDCATAAEVQTLARITEGVLRPHAESETNLAYAALDHALAERGQLDRLYQDHDEIDERLRSVQPELTCAQARRLLQAALAAARNHFRFEERHVFPLLEQTLPGDTLDELGQAWFARQAEAQPAAP